MKKDNKGFSLVELLVVIAIMVVLVGVIAPSLLGNIEKSRESRDVQVLDTIAATVQVGLANEEFYGYAEDGKYASVKLSDAFKSEASTEYKLLAKILQDSGIDKDYIDKNFKSKAAKGNDIVIKVSGGKVTVEVQKSGALVGKSDTKSDIDMQVTR